MRKNEKLYPNLKSLLGKDYSPLVTVNQIKFWKQSVKPEVKKYNHDGQEIVSVMWSTSEGNQTSASPAHRHGFRQVNTDVEKIIQNMTEACALTGCASDYHFILQNAHEALHKQRKSNPEVYKYIKEICLFDVMLIDRFSDEVFHGGKPYGIIAFKRLPDLYQQEGQIKEAILVLQIAAKFGQAKQEDIEILQELVTDL